MSKKLKHQGFHFSLGMLFRVTIFSLIVYFSINYLSGAKSVSTPVMNSNVLGISTQPVIIKATETYESYKKQMLKFVNDQVIDIKKQIVTKVYEDVIKNIENKP